MNHKLYSIVVNFNGGEIITKQVKNLFLYSAIDKLIIVDNGSTDGTLESLKLFAAQNNKLQIIENKRNIGFGPAANIGIRVGLKDQAQKFLLLNPDVKITNRQITELNKSFFDITSPVLRFERQGKTTFDFGGKVNFIFGRTQHFESENNNLHMMPNIDYVSGACMLITRKVIEKIGGFDERFFMYFEDVDLCMRAKKANFTVKVSKNIIISHEITEQKQSQNIFKISKNLRSNLLFIQKWTPWYFWPASFIYIFLLTLKILSNKINT